MLPASIINNLPPTITSLVNPDPGILFYNAIQLLGVLGIYKGEVDSPMPYSKFAADVISGKDSASAPAMVSSKTGMLIIYVPATIVAAIFQMILPALAPENYAPTIAGWMLLAHFLKRDLEVLFLHKYSGETAANAAKFIGFSYALTTLMISIVTKPEVSNLISSTNVQAGILLFVLGSLGNLYHHSLLAKLRSSGTKKYTAPRGGLFEFVAAPHYLFELVAWLGISLASQQLTSHLNLASMTCYLAARSYNQNQWNKKKFEENEWPSSRKNLIPFVY